MRGNLRRALALVRRRTHREVPLPVQLLEREGCELCRETFRALTRVGLDRALLIERIDVGQEGRYLLRVPLLRVGESELDAAGLDDHAIARWLNEVEPAG